jgi:hypothetical protein
MSVRGRCKIKKRIFRWPTRPEEGVRLRGTPPQSTAAAAAKVRVTTRREHDFVISRHPELMCTRLGTCVCVCVCREKRIPPEYNAKTLEKLLSLYVKCFECARARVCVCVNILTMSYVFAVGRGLGRT